MALAFFYKLRYNGNTDAMIWQIEKHPILGVWYAPKEKVSVFDFCIIFIIISKSVYFFLMCRGPMILLPSWGQNCELLMWPIYIYKWLESNRWGLKHINSSPEIFWKIVTFVEKCPLFGKWWSQPLLERYNQIGIDRANRALFFCDWNHPPPRIKCF